MCFAYVDGLIASRFQQRGIDGISGSQSLPIPSCWSISGGIVALRIDPVGRAVTGGVLPREQGDPRGRTDTLRIEGAETNALLSQSFHVGCPIPVVQRMAEGLACGIYVEGEGGVHQSHVIY